MIIIPRDAWDARTAGSECQCVVLRSPGGSTNRVVCKIYGSQARAEEVMRTQRRAASQALAPLPMLVVRAVVEGQKRIRHGYLSQYVRPLDEVREGFGEPDHGKAELERLVAEIERQWIVRAGDRVAPFNFGVWRWKMGSPQLVMLDWGHAKQRS